MIQKLNIILISSYLLSVCNIILSPIQALQVTHPHKREIMSASVSGSSNNNKYNNIKKKNSRSRRDFLLSSSTFISGITLLHPQKVNAACLTGDTSEQCIGVYKVPIDEEILPYIETKEKLEKYAPGINWIPPTTYPKSYKDAIQEFNTMETNIKDVADNIQKGSLTLAGVQLLQMIPRFTVCGRVILQTLEGREDINQDMYSMIEDRYLILYASIQNCDVMIGQGLRGQMGVSAVAQIHILSELKQIEFDYNYFLKQVVSLS